MARASSTSSGSCAVITCTWFHRLWPVGEPRRWGRLLPTLSLSADGFVYANNHFAGCGFETIRQLQAVVGAAPPAAPG